MTETKKRGRGRPPGSRNKSTLMKEAQVSKIVRGAQNYILTELLDVLKAMAQKAKEGDVAAAKLILDRAIPARRAIDEMPKTNLGIQINITPSEVTHEEADLQSECESHGQASEGRKGLQVVTIDGSATGE